MIEMPFRLEDGTGCNDPGCTVYYPVPQYGCVGCAFDHAYTACYDLQCGNYTDGYENLIFVTYAEYIARRMKGTA